MRRSTLLSALYMEVTDRIIPLLGFTPKLWPVRYVIPVLAWCFTSLATSAPGSARDEVAAGQPGLDRVLGMLQPVHRGVDVIGGCLGHAEVAAQGDVVPPGLYRLQKAAWNVRFFVRAAIGLYFFKGSLHKPHGTLVLLYDTGRPKNRVPDIEPRYFSEKDMASLLAIIYSVCVWDCHYENWSWLPIGERVDARPHDVT
jgi:hypothetical protein